MLKILHIGNMKSGIDKYVRNTISFIADDFDFVIVCGKDDQHEPVVRHGHQVREYAIPMYRALNPLKDLMALILAITYKLLLMSKGVAYTDARLYNYLLRDDSIEGRYDPKKIEDGLAVLKSMDDNIAMFQGIEKAYLSRKFSFLLHLLLTMPKGATHYEEMVNDVKRLRKTVLFDIHGRKKARMAAIVSFLGMGILKSVFSFVNKRK